MNDAPSTQEDVVVALGLIKQFNAGPIAVVAVNEVDLRLPRGKLVALRGSSGCGKSTLLNLLGALDRPTGGVLTVDGVNVAGLRGKAEVGYRRHKTGFVFQSFNLIPHLTATENVMLPMEFTGLPRRQQEERARAILKRVGIDFDRQDHRPARLSGGQQQRVAIARAIANEPAIVLADEPTANLDSKTGSKIVELLHELAIDGRTVVVATHDSAIASRADVVVEMSDGRVVGQSTGYR